MDDLDGRIEVIAEFFWGKPTRSTPGELRFGAHGSKSLDRVNKRWFDHETQKGGNVVTLIRENIPGGNEPGAVQKFLTDTFGAEFEHYQAPVEDLSVLRRPDEPQRIVATYEYYDADGVLAYMVHRMGPRKTFWQQLPDGRKPKDDPDFRALPFHLPELLAQPDQPVWIVEGEKDVLTLEAHGLIATCNHGGAGSWHECHAEWLRGRKCVILPDNDEAGRNHANKVAASLAGRAEVIKIVELAGLEEKGDVTDWLETHSIAELKSIVKAVAPVAKIETKIPIMSMADVMAMPPTEWLVQDLIPQNSIAMIYGASGSGKTFLVLSMLAAISQGRNWFDKWTSSGCVVLVAGEGVGGLRKRLLAYQEAHGMDIDAPLLIVPRAVNLMDDEDVGALIETIEMIRADRQVRMVVFDTLARSMQGEADENSAQAMGQAITAMDRVRNAFKCAVVPIHHTGKDGGKERGARGSTALIGACDTSIFVARHDGDLVEVAVQKQKDAEALLPMFFRSKKVQFQAHALDDIEDSIVLKMCEETPQDVKSATLSTAQHRVLEALTEALIRYGRVPAMEGVTWRCVREEQWREIALDMTISQSGPEADRKAFVRAAQALVGRGYVEKRSGWVWNVEMALNRTNPEDFAE